jgi:hypothetical protein
VLKWLKISARAERKKKHMDSAYWQRVPVRLSGCNTYKDTFTCRVLFGQCCLCIVNFVVMTGIPVSTKIDQTFSSCSWCNSAFCVQSPLPHSSRLSMKHVCAICLHWILNRQYLAAPEHVDAYKNLHKNLHLERTWTWVVGCMITPPT